MKRVIATNKAPQAIGPYSQAIEANGWLFLSGQVAIVPESGELLETDIQSQTRQVLQNCQAVLTAAQSSLAEVVKATVYLTDMNHFPEMNKVYATFFPDSPPARCTVQVSRLPKNALIEIELIAQKRGSQES